ncbi:MAG: hypothetical protein Q4A27_03320 [bacterium]|nr:hypothetical protein [bacterium]
MRLKDIVVNGELEIPAREIAKRAKLFCTRFSEEQFLRIKLDDELAEILMNFPFSKYFSPKQREKFENILCTALRLDFDDPNLKLGHRNYDKMHSFSNETIRTLLDFENFNQLEPFALREIFDLILQKILPEELLADFIQTLNEKHISNNHKFWRKLEIYEIRSIDEDFLDFILEEISLHYYNQYRQLGHYYKIEFWKWAKLKAQKVLKNPANRFFEAKTRFENELENGTLKLRVLEEIRRERRRIEALSKDRMTAAKMLSKSYIWRDEISNLNFEINRLRDEVPRIKDGEKSNIHHMFFPSEEYRAVAALKTYRGKSINKIRVLLHAHEKMNMALQKFDREFGTPILTPELIAAIKAHREVFDDSYLNFLGLMRAFAEICDKTMPAKDENDGFVSEVFMLSARFYDLFQVQRRSINLKTIR